MKRTTRREIGRPTKLTPESKQRLLSAVRQGNYLQAAARYAGIHESTLYYWLDRGRREKSGEYFDFSESLEQAEAEAEVALVAAWRAHAPADYRAASLMLARRHPERWAPREVAPSEVTVSIKHVDAGRDRASNTARRTKRDQRK